MGTSRLYVVNLLEKEMTYKCRLWHEGNEILLEINDTDFENNMGYLVRQIQGIIERNLPEREDDLSIVIKNTDKLTNHRLKIWKPEFLS